MSWEWEASAVLCPVLSLSALVNTALHFHWTFLVDRVWGCSLFLFVCFLLVIMLVPMPNSRYGRVLEFEALNSYFPKAHFPLFWQSFQVGKRSLSYSWGRAAQLSCWGLACPMSYRKLLWASASSPGLSRHGQPPPVLQFPDAQRLCSASGLPASAEDPQMPPEGKRAQMAASPC